MQDYLESVCLPNQLLFLFFGVIIPGGRPKVKWRFAPLEIAGDRVLSTARSSPRESVRDFGCAEDAHQFITKSLCGSRMSRHACQVGPLVRIGVVVVELFFTIRAERVSVPVRTNREMRNLLTIPDGHQGYRWSVPCFAVRFLQQRPQRTAIQTRVAAAFVRLTGQPAQVHQRGVEVYQ